MTEIRVGNRFFLMQFQKKILLSNTSLKEFLIYMKEEFSDKFKVEYIITKKQNQNILENFFAYVRAIGAAHSHHTV